MNWNKLQTQHYHDEPVEHICATNLIDLDVYDRLYENQNNLSHPVWQEFCERYNTKAKLHDNFTKINFDKDVICLWFFRDRNDRTAAYVHVAGKQIKFNPNVLLLSRSKSIKMFYSERKYIRSPVIQIDMNIEDYNNIMKRFQK